MGACTFAIYDYYITMVLCSKSRSYENKKFLNVALSSQNILKGDLVLTILII